MGRATAIIGLLASYCFAQQPTITGVGNSASYVAYIAQGELVTIFGSNLADGTYQAKSLPLPTTLGTTQVFAADQPLQLLYASPGQINLLMSGVAPVACASAIANPTCISLVVAVGGIKSAAMDVLYALSAPALFSPGFDCPYTGWQNSSATNVPCGLSPVQKPGQFQRALVTDSTYALVTNDNPARLGRSYTAWITGLGSPGAEGDLRSKFRTLRLELSRCCLLSYFREPIADATLLYAGAAPGFPGLYQLNFTLPTLPKIKISVDGCGALQLELWLTVVTSTVSSDGGEIGSNSVTIPLLVSTDENACL